MAYEGFALVEQMGFRQTVAKVSEVEQFGTKMMRLDVPVFDGDAEVPSSFITRFAGGPSIYQVTPLADDVAISMAHQQQDPRPVKPTPFRISNHTAD